MFGRLQFFEDFTIFSRMDFLLFLHKGTYDHPLGPYVCQKFAKGTYWPLEPIPGHPPESDQSSLFTVTAHARKK